MLSSARSKPEAGQTAFDQHWVKNHIASDPQIFTIDNFVSDTECDHLIELGRPKLERALVSGQDKGMVSKGRSGSNNWVAHNASLTSLAVSIRIANLINMPLENAESLQIIHYGVEQEYRGHYDGWEHNKSEKTFRNMKLGGQRIYTCLCYLNDVKEGGGTRFNRLNINVQAQKGRLLVFSNVIKNTNTRHPLSMHAGMPVISGEKYAFNLWFREKTRQKPYKDFHPEYFEVD